MLPAAAQLPLMSYVVARGDDRPLRISAALASRLGYDTDAADAAVFVEALHPEDRDRVLAGLQGGERATREYRLLTRDGEVVWVHDETVAIDDDHLFGVLVDVSATKEAEQRYRELLEHASGRRRAEDELRLETVSRLAGGLAHDFNNLLTAISGYGELIDRRLADDDPAHRELDVIREAAERATTLTNQLLAFSRQQILQPQTIAPNDVVRGLEPMLRRLAGDGVLFEARLADDVAFVRADPSRLEQVLVSLVQNARDAMPDGGRLTIETAAVEVSPESAEPWGIEPGRHVLLRVTDTGRGMDAETQSQVFEPFFTTKRHGAGTGLGLSTVFGIVTQSGGAVWIDSEPGRGASINLCLPQVDPPAAEAVEEEAAAAANHTADVERVLLIEDEQVVRTLVREILEHEGYEVLEATTPEEALALGASDANIHVLLTDVVMPGMNGPQIAAQLSASNPALRVLYMSGYTDEAVVRHGVSDGTTAFLQKPFTARELAAKVRDVLDDPLERARA